MTLLMRSVGAVVLVEDHDLPNLERLMAVVAGLLAQRIRLMDLPAPEVLHGEKVPVQVPTTSWPLMMTTHWNVFGVGDGVGEGLGVGAGGVGVGDATGLGDGEATGDGEGVGTGEGDGLGAGEGIGTPASHAW